MWDIFSIRKRIHFVYDRNSLFFGEFQFSLWDEEVSETPVSLQLSLDGDDLTSGRRLVCYPNYSSYFSTFSQKWENYSQ